MTTILDRTVRHGGSGFDWWSRAQGDDPFVVDIPKNEKFENTRIEFSGKNNVQAVITVEPAQGETGKGKAINVHWSYLETANPTDPPYIEYRLRAFSAPDPTPSKKRAILVAIENTLALPFDLSISPEIKQGIENFLEKILNFSEETNCKNLFKNYYQEVVVLSNKDCTKENIRAQIASLGKKYILDLSIQGHGAVWGGEEVLILNDGMDQWWSNPLNLRPPDVLAWKSQPEFQDVRLGLVYMMNCYGSQFNQTWLELGFKSSIGAKDVNWMPEPMFTLFWTRFRNGEIAIKAAQKAWEDAKNIWKAIYLPLIQLEKTDTPPFFTLAYTENPRIIASTPVVAGNEGFRIIDL